MSIEQTIQRINELYRKMKSSGLSEEELQEQKELRHHYMDLMKQSLRAQLDSIKWTDDESDK